MKTKYLKATTKKLKTGKLMAIASTPNVDRVGDSIEQKDWDLSKFKANPVLQAGHDYRPQYTIGIAKDIHIDEKGNLVFEPIFHELTSLAKSIKAMYESTPPMLKAWSVGFIPNAMSKNAKGEKRGMNELLEVSAVAVPANAEALTYAKSYGEREVKKVKSWIEKIVSDDTLIDNEDGEEMDPIENIPTPTDELVEGEKCITSEGASGTAILDGEVLVCKINKKELIEGDVCTLPDGSQGALMIDTDSGKMVCMPIKKVDVEEEKNSENKEVENKELNEDLEEVEVESKVDEEVETITEELNSREKSELKWNKVKEFDKIVYAFYSVYMDEKTEVESFDTLLNEVIVLLGDLIGVSEAKAYKGNIFKASDFDGDILDVLNISIKEGRVLSSKNVELLTECISILKQASKALDNLLTATTPKEKQIEKSQEKAKEIEEVKGREIVKEVVNQPAKKNLDADRIVLQALQKIAGLSARAIHEKKKIN